MARTTTFRLTAAFGAVFLLAVTILLGLIYVLTERELTGRTDKVLALQAHELAGHNHNAMLASVRAAIAANTSGLTYFALLGPDGRVLVANLGAMPVGPQNRVYEADGRLTNGGIVPLRLLAVPAGDGGQLVLARDITQIRDLRARVLSILVSCGLLAIVGGLATGILLSIAPLRRIQRLTADAKAIANGDFGVRMEVSGRRDELDIVARTINTMVEEIGELMGQVKGATDAIAHDLRTPLALVRSRLDRATRPDQPAPIVEVVQSAVGELDLVLARFNALLRIAELEATSRRAGFGPLDPMPLASAVCELFEPLAEEREIHLSLSGDWGLVIQGDDKLLFEAISNLVENAIKFAPHGGRVVLKVSAAGEHAIIAVRDNGPGIAPAERAHVLRRHHRGNMVRAVPGSGLGLSLVAAIISLHGFALEIGDAAPGLEVKILCPITKKIAEVS